MSERKYFYTARNESGLFLWKGRFLPFNAPKIEDAFQYETVNDLIDDLSLIQGLDLSFITLYKVDIDDLHCLTKI